MARNPEDRAEVEYILGYSERETRRLMQQAAMLRPITERMLREAGISAGMRVLDLGSGAGDVSMLAAELVGSSGSVVGIDRSPESVAFARRRAEAADLGNVEFRQAAFHEFSDPRPFDAVVGRYVLIHQPDPVALLRTAAALARPGGIVAFHELSFRRGYLQSLPEVPLWDQAGEWLRTAFSAVAPHYDVGARLIEHFAKAGLRQPTVFGELIVGGGTSTPLYAWITATVAGVVPQLVRMQAATAEEIAIETLEERLRTAVVEAGSQIVGPAQFCAWTTV